MTPTLSGLSASNPQGWTPVLWAAIQGGMKGTFMRERPQRLSLFFLILIGPMLVGCGDKPDLPRPPEGPTRLVFASSGSLRWTSLLFPPFQLDFSSTADLGGEELELFRVRDALFLRRTLVIANGGSEELLYVDPEEGAVRRFGGKAPENSSDSRHWSQPRTGILWMGLPAVFLSSMRMVASSRH